TYQELRSSRSCWHQRRHRWRYYYYSANTGSERANKSSQLSAFFLINCGRRLISIDIKHKNYAGEYEIDGGILYVFFQGRSTSSAVVSPGPELLARLLLIDLIFQTPSWRDHPSL